MTIILLNRKYLNELTKLNELAFKSLKNKLGSYSSKGVRDYFEFTLKKGKLFGYFVDKKLVACIGIVINKEFKYGEVEHVLVNPNFQKKGIAKKLMEFIESYARKASLEWLRLNVRCKNQNAISFYEHFRYNKYAYIMVKKLK